MDGFLAPEPSTPEAPSHPQKESESMLEHQPGGHQVVVVEHLDERLDLGPLGHLLLAHGGGNFAGVAVDAGDQSVAVGTVGCAVIDVLKADSRCLLASGWWYRPARCWESVTPTNGLDAPSR